MFLGVAIFLSPPTFIFAQSNEWINTNQTYYKIPIAKTGVYRINYNDLQAAGFPLNSVDPRFIQLYHRGVEQAIFFKHDQVPADAKFDNTEYLEFFGQQNDGTLDKDLYQTPSLQPHSYYNLYSDTTAYFLTWSFGSSPGKRITSFDEANVTNIPKEAFHMEERLLVNKNQYALGVTESDVIQLSRFDQGEGWTGTAISQGQLIDYELDVITNIVTTGPNPTLEVLLVGRDQIPHMAEILAGPNVSSLRSLGTQSFNGFETVTLSFPLNWTDMSAQGKLVVRFVAAPDVATNRPQFSVSYIKLTYPQHFQSSSLIQKTFNLLPNPSGKSYVEFANAPSNMRLWDITNPNTITSVGVRLLGEVPTAVVESTGVSRKLFGFTTTLSASVNKISFRLIEPTQSNYIILSHRLLMKPALNYANPVNAYAAYRASAAGGSYDTLVLPMDLLYNQFNYGETSPRAIYEFMRLMVDRGNPKYLFLIGKGRDVNAAFYRQANQNAIIYKDFVPTGGMPGSDMSFTAGLGGTTYEPAVATGRLSVTSPSEVAAYLNKVKETESSRLGDSWQKKALHLSGGIKPNEMPLFRYFVDGFKEIAEKEYWGASVATISKQDPSPVELINISDQINEGVNMVTFFGHSAPNNTDIDIGFVTDPVMGYNNAGKYPAFLINGCQVGSFFLNDAVIGENWINAANRGARNFIAHSSYGFASSLRKYTTLFYSIAFADSNFVAKGIGDVQKEVARQYMKSVPVMPLHIAQVQQMILLGDPALRLITALQPDYEVSSASLISFDDKPVTSLVDSFALKLVVKNHGLAKLDPLKIKVMRTLKNGQELSYDSIFGPVINLDTLIFTIYKDNETGGGNTTFTIHLDPENQIKEFNEDNNMSTLEAFIPSNTTLHLFPYSYSIVHEKSVRLTWQATDIFSVRRDFQLEVDTSMLFNTPFLIKKVVSGNVLANTLIALANTDSTVYYWRTRFDKPNSEESSEWVLSSFSFIEGGVQGWAQLRQNQLKENFFSGLLAEGEGKPFKFEGRSTSVSITTFGSANPALYTDVSVKIDDSEYNIASQGQPCRNNTINLLAFNKSTAIPYAAIPFGFFDPRACGRQPQLINSFQPSEFETGLDDLIAVIDNIGLSDSVVIFSIGDPGYASWSASVKLKLGELGVGLAELNSLQSGEPMIIFGKKGVAPGSATVFRPTLTPANEQLLSVSKNITGRNTEGVIKSVLIGPASAWIKFTRSVVAVEPTDQITFPIYGVDRQGVETLIIDNAGNGFDLSQVSVEQFPFLRLAYHIKDEINLTPANWKDWMIEYEPVAEGVLLYKDNAIKKRVQEGQSWKARFAFVNISDRNFKNDLKVELNVITRQTQHRLTKDSLIVAPLPQDTIFFTVSSSTLGKVGVNDVNVFVNKRQVPEQYYDNNFGSLAEYLVVQPDKTKPLLEVTFDGRVLRNNDFVSSSPIIQLKLKDENPFILKTDTVGVTILLSYPCNAVNCPFTRIPMSSRAVKWYPATLTSDFRVDFTPTNLVEGMYVLSVQAIDASGNPAGTLPYQISFQVKAETLLNFKGVYPNPSSTGFFFNFELLGNTLPNEFLLEIFSATGQRVNQFGIEDIRKFYIGTNELNWNGEDASGNIMPNGVYIYRLRMKASDKSIIEKGKLVWIR
jgi:hypothetical protein